MPRHIAVDFDGTLAQYDGWQGIGVYGPPVPRMLARVKEWVAAGIPVVIFTARVSGMWEGSITERLDCTHEYNCIRKWLVANGLPELEVTAVKHKYFTEFWDDRAVGVFPNTGRIKDFADHFEEDIKGR